MMQQHLMMSALRQQSVPVAETGLRQCVQCGTSSTPQWREGPLGPKTLCNACGVRRHRTLKRGQKPQLQSAVPRTASQRQTTGKQPRRPPSSGATGGHSETSEDVFEWDAEVPGHSTDDTDDERTAALNLLCFAAAPPPKKPRRTIVKPLRYSEVSDATPAASASASGSVSHAAAPAAAMAGTGASLLYQGYPSGPAYSQPATAAPVAAGSGGAVATSIPGGGMGGRNDPELHMLHQLYCIVQQACRELAAADTAKEAVARVLAQKQEESVRAREEAQRYSHLLNVEVQQVSTRYLPAVGGTTAAAAASVSCLSAQAPAAMAAASTAHVQAPMPAYAGMPGYLPLAPQPYMSKPLTTFSIPSVHTCTAR